MNEVVERPSIPAEYGDAPAQYAAVRSGGAGLIDFSNRGRIQLSGSEAVPFLNGLITNDVKSLAPGSWMTAAFPNVQGRMLAVVRILNQGEHFLIDTEPATYGKVRQLLERFTLAGDFRVTDVTSQTVSFSVQGTGASAVVGSALGEAVATVERQRILQTNSAAGALVSLIRTTHTGEDGFDLFVAAEHAPSLWDALLGGGAQAIEPDMLELLRVEAGVARYGVDMDETTIVSETNLDEAVSFTKGCYIGQEIIARIKYRGHVAKKLTGLVFDNGDGVNAGARITAADKDAGRVTSAAYSPQRGRTIALAYVKYEFLAAGTNVLVIQDEVEHSAQVAELPFVRGSWWAAS
jgi:aminomethyltransferase